MQISHLTYVCSIFNNYYHHPTWSVEFFPAVVLLPIKYAFMQDNICFDFFYIYLFFCFCFFNASIPLKNITHSNPQLFIKLKKRQDSETSHFQLRATYQDRENQRHNIDGPRRTETGEHGEPEVAPHRGNLPSLLVLHKVRAPIQRGLGVHDWLQHPPRQ